MDRSDGHPQTPSDTSGGIVDLVRRAQVPVGQAALAALGLYIASEAHSLGLWTTLGPGAGLLPLVLGLALVGLTAVWVVQTIVAHRRGTEADNHDDVERLDGRYVTGILVGLILLASLMDLLGFQISMALFLFIELMWLGRQRWWLSAVVALVASIGTFVLFDRVLGVALPLSSLPALAAMGL